MQLENEKSSRKKNIIGINISNLSFNETCNEIIRLAGKRISSYVCVCNVHMFIEAKGNNSFNGVLNNANIVTPDGMPIAKAFKILLGINQERVCGMDLLPQLLKLSEINGLSVFFLGSTETVLQKTQQNALKQFPMLKIIGSYSPPFRKLTNIEEASVITMINESNANIVMVALGCPKQEIWMAEHLNKINALMIGLGGAFPIFAGVKKRAPVWMQKSSLEWLYRFLQEPKRLFKRYFITNSKFLFLLSKEIINKSIRTIFN